MGRGGEGERERGRGGDEIEIYNLIKCSTDQQTLGGLMIKSTRFLRQS